MYACIVCIYMFTHTYIHTHTSSLNLMWFFGLQSPIVLVSETLTKDLKMGWPLKSKSQWILDPQMCYRYHVMKVHSHIHMYVLFFNLELANLAIKNWRPQWWSKTRFLTWIVRRIALKFTDLIPFELGLRTLRRCPLPIAAEDEHFFGHHGWYWDIQPSISHKLQWWKNHPNWCRILWTVWYDATLLLSLASWCFVLHQTASLEAIETMWWVLGASGQLYLTCTALVISSSGYQFECQHDVPWPNSMGTWCRGMSF